MLAAAELRLRARARARGERADYGDYKREQDGELWDNLRLGRTKDDETGCKFLRTGGSISSEPGAL
jgi:hypothetical protein